MPAAKSSLATDAPPGTGDRRGRDHAPARARARLAGALCALATALAALPGLAQEYQLAGPLPARDLTAYHLTRLEMVPAQSSSALGNGWNLEVDLTHANTFVKSPGVLDQLKRRGGRKPFSAQDAQAVLAIRGDVSYLDGELGLLAPTLRYKLDERRSLFLVWPLYYFTGGIFDSTIEGFHHAFGLGNGDRQFVARNEFRVVYRVGREQVVQLGAPPSGLSDPILGIRCRLLPPGSRWDLIVELAARVALRRRGGLSTGGSDLGLQLALHRTFGRQGRQALYLDWSEVHLGGPLPDRRLDRNSMPAYVAGYEIGLTHQTSVVVQAYMSPSVFRHSAVATLAQNRYELLAGVRSRRGPLTWHLVLVENIIHLENTPDVGAQIGLGWRFGNR
ncbi:MAG TPA: DUF3187 family protein [Thermoanaerobaculia bacterium]|nr:DUF3187 family protein [Thermoanaerobaculia bacterium]